MRTILRNLLILGIGIAIGVALFTQFKSVNLDNFKFFSNKNSKTTPAEITETKTIVREKSDVIDTVKKVRPSVVSIAIQRRLRNFFELSPFNDLPATSQGTRESGIGTGFIISSNGVILTNKHVVESDGQYVVITHDNKKYNVLKVTTDPLNDLAIIKIDANNLTPAELGDSSQLDVGQTVIAMGNALGEFKNTVTVGVVSGLEREIEASDGAGGGTERLGNVIQTDAAINPGNSGGPLLNIAGQVIGINTAVAPSEIAQNIGFAIPVNSAKPMITEFLTSGKISRPYLGVQYRMVSKRLSVLNDIPEGAYVDAVVPGGPAEKAGIKSGDIITQLNGKQLTEEDPLQEVIRALKIGDQVEVKYFRDTAEQTTRVTIGEAGEQ